MVYGSTIVSWRGKDYFLYSGGFMVENEHITHEGKTYSANGKGELTQESNYYLQEDYDYLVALGTESPTYDGLLAVAYCVINRANESGKSIRQEVTQKGAFSGFIQAEVGNPRNQSVEPGGY